MCENIEARFVRGNAFKFQIDVVAYTESGRRVENFELGEAVLKCGNKTPLTVKPYEVVDGTTILVSFDGTETLGIYGMEMTGTFEGEAWRWAYRKVFQIVETNEAAHLPEGCIVLKDTLFMTAEVVVGGVGTQVQADWLESDPVSPAFIKNKPNVYVKPSGGIPKSDLSSSVQTSLNKANSALQDAFVVVDAGTLTKTLNQYTIAQSVYNSVNAIMNAGKIVIVTAHLDDDNRDVACVMAKKGSDYDGCDVRGNVSVYVHLTPFGGWAAYKELQDVLVSGTNIKTVNDTSLLGNGNLSITAFELIDAGSVPVGRDGYELSLDFYDRIANAFTAGKIPILTATLNGTPIINVTFVMTGDESLFIGYWHGGQSSHKFATAQIDRTGGLIEVSEDQEKLVSGTNIKTVNGNSLLGSGDVSVGTYILPRSGIPSTDLESGVQTSLGKADSAVQPAAIENMEVTTNKVTSISSSSTDTQYPSAKCVYDLVGDIETLLAAI